MKNPKTTIIGILLIVGTLCGVGVQLLRGETVDLQAVIAAVLTGLAGVGLVTAKDAPAKCLLPILLIPALLMPGCITIRAIDDTGTQSLTTRVDVDAIVAITQLVIANTPAALELIPQIQDALAKPDSPSKTDQLLALLEQARVLLEVFRTNQSAAVIDGSDFLGGDITAPGPFLTLRPDGSVR